MSDLKVEIISAEGLLFKGNCNMAVVPSSSGDIGFMAGHETVLSSLREGEIMIYDLNQAIIKSIKIVSGFAEMQGSDHLSILVDQS